MDGPRLFTQNRRCWPVLELYALTLTNQERTRRLGANCHLAWHEGAAATARLHSEDQLANGYMAHISPQGEDIAHRLQRLGISYQCAGENIGWLCSAGDPTWSNVVRIHQGLLDSPGHRANLLERHFRFMGVGIAACTDQIYITQVFLG